VGGFDPAFRVNYNDVDFCLKIRQLGRIVYTPYALLYHYESVSKDEAPETELEKFNKKWSQVVGNDPAYNRHLSQTSSVCAIGYPVRSLYMDY
jgi:GT2 family glycosyltransferase